MRYTLLSSEEIVKTIEKLSSRIGKVFPDSGLLRICNRLLDTSKETAEIESWIIKPNYLLRSAIYMFIALLILTIIFSITQLEFADTGLSAADIVQITEAALNEMVLIGAGILFLTTLENRRKRKRVVHAINNLRSVAHIIDAHQLTKDPDHEIRLTTPPGFTREDRMDVEKMGNYLDFCSEMLSLTSKIGFLYIQHFDDPIANNSVNELETLTTGLSKKIWHKIMILHTRDNR